MELMHIDIPLNLCDFTDNHYLAMKSELEKRSVTLEKALFRHELTADEWKEVEEYAKKLNVDYEQRAELMLKRLDVTVDSFLWSDRVKKLEEQILDTYSPVRCTLKCPPPVLVEDLIAARTNLLIVEKASSRQIRQTTCNEFNAFTVSDRPMDRGGRTTEMVAPQDYDANRMKSSSDRQNHGGGKWNNNQRNQGGGFFQQYRNQRNDHIENQVRQQYSDGQDSGRGRGWNRGGGGGKRKFQQQ